MYRKTILVTREHEHNLTSWRCPNCGGDTKKEYWPLHTISCHDKFCSNCGIGLKWEKETYKEDFYDKHAQRHATYQRW